MRVHEQIVERVLDLIQNEPIPAGQAIPAERVLAERFGYSRAAVREALRALEHRGILVARHGAGHFVRELPSVHRHPRASDLEAASIADILEVRAFLEQQVVTLACQRRTREEAQHLVDLAERLGGWEDNQRFHTAMAAATHNFMLEQLMVQQMDLLGQLRQRDHYADKSVAAELLAEHRDMAAAIMARDEAAAVNLVQRHLRHTRLSLSDVLGVSLQQVVAS